MNALLFLEPGQPCSMSTLADAWKCDASNVTWLVDRLEEHGLAERRPHPTDRRVRTVALTRKGTTMRAQIESKLFEAPASLHDLSVPTSRRSAGSCASSRPKPTRSRSLTRCRASSPSMSTRLSPPRPTA